MKTILLSIWKFLEDVCGLLKVDYRWLRSIARTCWDHWISYSEVGRKVLDKDDKSTDKVVDIYRLRLVKHVLRVCIHCLTWCMTRDSEGIGWKIRVSKSKYDISPWSHWLLKWVVWKASDYLVRVRAIIVAHHQRH